MVASSAVCDHCGRRGPALRRREAITGLFKVSDNRAYAFESMPAIFPKSVAPIVRVAEDGEREMVPATWGFPLLKQG